MHTLIQKKEKWGEGFGYTHIKHGVFSPQAPVTPLLWDIIKKGCNLSISGFDMVDFKVKTKSLSLRGRPYMFTIIDKEVNPVTIGVVYSI